MVREAKIFFLSEIIILTHPNKKKIHHIFLLPSSAMILKAIVSFFGENRYQRFRIVSLKNNRKVNLRFVRVHSEPDSDSEELSVSEELSSSATPSLRANMAFLAFSQRSPIFSIRNILEVSNLDKLRIP